MSPDHESSIHPLIREMPDVAFSPLMEQFIKSEIVRKAENKPRTGGIDLSRYEEAPEPPSDPATLEDWRATLRKAYTLDSHQSIRYANLSLLEENGRNAWLVANSQLEDILRVTEQELAQTKESVESVNRQRKMAQEAHKAELGHLEETWRRGVGAALEAEAAAEGVRMQILEQRRQIAQRAAR